MDILRRVDDPIIRDLLIQWRDSGVADPVMPVYEDENGDGIPDLYALDAFGALVIVAGVAIEDTVAVPTGGGVETTGPAEGT